MNKTKHFILEEYNGILKLKNSIDSITGFEWTRSQRIDLGILSSNYAFVEGKKQKINHVEFAKSIAKEITPKLPEGITVTTAGPYLNIVPNSDFWNMEVNHNSLTNCMPKSEDILMMEYFSPNVGKKMHIGHIRSANIGEAISRIMSLKYPNVITNNHLGDWGIQFGIIIWGIQNLASLNLDIKSIDWNGQTQTIIDQLYQIYVAVNAKIKEQGEDLASGIRSKAQKIASDLEQIKADGATTDNQKELYELFESIIEVSVRSFESGELDLSLNKNKSDWDKSPTIKRVEALFGGDISAFLHPETNDKFDMIIGESRYVPFVSFFDTLVDKGLAISEDKAIYIDLEDQGLGRCYVISSQGYSLYHSRDIIARFLWAGAIGAKKMITLADNRQSHSFKQTFAVINKVIESGILQSSPFPGLTQEETDTAVSTLTQEMARHVSFGFMSLKDGAMSTRKGKIIAYTDLRDQLKNAARESLTAKGYAGNTPDEDTVDKVFVAALKWADLHRDRDQDVVFDMDDFVGFEGNTGIYQLYTVARLHGILANNTEPLYNINWDLLNVEEQNILKQIYMLPMVLEEITRTYKPHILCTHLHEVALAINSWYSKYSVNQESDAKRKSTMFTFCYELIRHQEFGLILLGIETVKSL